VKPEQAKDSHIMKPDTVPELHCHHTHNNNFNFNLNNRKRRSQQTSSPTRPAGIISLFLLSITLVSAAFFHDISPDPNMRAWTCHGRSQREMVDRLCQANIIQSEAVRQVMLQVDRGNYFPHEAAYQDTPQGIGAGQTISAPHMHGHALQEMYPVLAKQVELHPQEPLKILDVGSGSGYLTACLGRWVKSKDDDSENILGAAPGSKVFGIDVHASLIEQSITNMKRQDSDLLDDDSSNTVTIQLGDGWKGLPDQAPFDAIHVGAAAADFPTELCNQLKVGGIMIIPIGRQNDNQALYKIVRVHNHQQEENNDDDSDEFHKEDFRVQPLMGVRYVPLVHPKN
jgi:protein-L-isoaspartate(D-aspartate) O-methyltransferase